MSEKSIFFYLVVFPFLPARSPRADDPRDFFMVSSPGFPGTHPAQPKIRLKNTPKKLSGNSVERD
jgi:hypothetical protein